MTDLACGGDPPDSDLLASLLETPRGTVTFLFTDIEGSTRLLHELGPDYAGLLEEQRSLLRAVFVAHRGREVDTAGDGFFVAFDRASDAVAAAADAQEALQRHPWSAGHRPRVRMGIHTGEPLEAGGAYVGVDVHRAARICSAGHGGQVLISRTTQELVRYDLPAGASLRELGAHRLKDLAHPEHLSQLVISGLQADFPPLRTNAPVTAHLPTPTTPFFGREREVEHILELICSRSVRLLTLTGPGGTGKTRLGVQVASAAAGAFADGVAFVPLAPITEADLVATAVARTIGMTEDPNRPVVERLKEQLRGSRILLVLDNFEHLTAAAPVVSELVSACPRLGIVVTSRVLLRIAGEHEFAVPPLDLPTAHRGRKGVAAEPPSLEALMSHSAVALFMGRAQSARPGFVLTKENAQAVAEICMRVDGLPLAIELAAARIRLLSPHELLARLDSRLDVLKGGSRDAPPRHRALRQTIALSYDLLTSDQKAFFRRMSVFAGGCTLRAAATVCVACGDLSEACAGCEEDSWGALDTIEALVDHSLMRREEGSDGASRFSMLETIREYGLECLRIANEETPVRRAHAAYYVALAEEAEPFLTGSHQAEWMDRLETEHDNLHAALIWTEQNAPEEGLRLAIALWRFWVARGHMTEGLARCRRMLDHPGNQGQTVERGRALNAAGTMAHEIGDVGTARQLLADSLEISRALGDKHGMALALNNLGWLATMASEDQASATPSSEEALALCTELGDKRGMAVALNNLAWSARLRSDYVASVSLFEESNALRLQAGDHRGYAFGLTWLGHVHTLQGKYDTAIRYVEKALSIMRELGDEQGIPNAMSFLGAIWSDLGDQERAIPLLRESETMFRSVGNRHGTAESLELLGRAFCSLGRWDEARRAYEETLTLYGEAGALWGVAEALCGLGCTAIGEGATIEDGEILIERALAIRRPMQDRRGVAECLEHLAQAALAKGEYAVAARRLGNAVALREKSGAPRPPRVQPACEAVAKRLRAELGDEVFASELAAGSAAVE